MKVLLTDWNSMRIIRLVLGAGVIAQGVYHREVIYYVVGGILVLMALANAGCCGTQGCAVDTKKVNVKEEKEIVYEEVDATK
jgi:hypothetical protein